MPGSGDGRSDANDRRGEVRAIAGKVTSPGWVNMRRAAEFPPGAATLSRMAGRFPRAPFRRAARSAGAVHLWAAACPAVAPGLATAAWVVAKLTTVPVVSARLVEGIGVADRAAVAGRRLPAAGILE